MSLSDGMGSGEEACRESEQVVDLTQQLLETGFSPRSALKLVNTVLLLSGAQHPATLDLSCVDLHTAVLEVMKLGQFPHLSLVRKAWNVWRPGRFLRGFCGMRNRFSFHGSCGRAIALSW